MFNALSSLKYCERRLRSKLASKYSRVCWMVSHSYNLMRLRYFPYITGRNCPMFHNMKLEPGALSRSLKCRTVRPSWHSSSCAIHFDIICSVDDDVHIEIHGLIIFFTKALIDDTVTEAYSSIVLCTVDTHLTMHQMNGRYCPNVWIG